MRPIEHDWQRIIREELHEELREKENERNKPRRISAISTLSKKRLT